MKDVNKVILIGRLGVDPTLRKTKTDFPYATFSLATSRKHRATEDEGVEPGTLVEETEWHRIVCWGKIAEHCAQYLKKGAPVFIEGEIRSSRYTDKEGEERTSFEIRAESVSFLGRPAAIDAARTTQDGEEGVEVKTA